MNCYSEGLTTNITVYVDRDNAVTIIPYSDVSERINYDMTEVIEVRVDADPVGSTVPGDAVQASSLDGIPVKVWFEQVIIDPDTGELQWRIYAKVGLFEGITAGEYTLRITIFDPSHANGLVLPDTDVNLRVTVIGLP